MGRETRTAHAIKNRMQINKIDWSSFGVHELRQTQLSHDKCGADAYLSSLK